MSDACRGVKYSKKSRNLPLKKIKKSHKKSQKIIKKSKIAKMITKKNQKIKNIKKSRTLFPKYYIPRCI